MNEINFHLWIFYSFIYFFMIGILFLLYEFRYLLSPKRLKVYFDYNLFLNDKIKQNELITDFVIKEIDLFYKLNKKTTDPELISLVKSLSGEYLFQYLKSDFAKDHNKWAYMINDVVAINEEDFIKFMYAKSNPCELSLLYLIGYEHFFQIPFVYKNGIINFSNKLIKIIALSIIFDPMLEHKIQSKAFDDFLNI